PEKLINPASSIAAWIGRQLSLFSGSDTAPPPTESTAPVAPVPGTDPAVTHQERTRGEAAVSFAELCRGPYAGMEVAVGKRLMDSWRVQWLGSRARLEVPDLLWEAPRPIKEAVLEWAALVRRRRTPGIRAARRALETRIQA